MSFELALIGTAMHILIWEKLPGWGTWFNAILIRLPGPLQTLYDQWRCAYCAGFWISLAVHGLTGLWTIPALGGLSQTLGGGGLVLGWFFDALASATLIYAAVLAVKAIGLPAMKAHMMMADFKKAAFGEDNS